MHRFGMLGVLREMNTRGEINPGGSLQGYTEQLERALAERLGAHDFLARIDCNRIVEETFVGERRGEIREVTAKLERALEEHTYPLLSSG